MPDVDAVLRGYIDAMLFSSNDESDDSGGEPLDRKYSSSDIASDSKRKMRGDVVKFLRANKKAISEYVEHREHNSNEGSVWEYLGHDLWFTQNGHGVGFWDRDYGGRDDIGERLTNACKKLGERYPYVGDDGKVHI